MGRARVHQRGHHDARRLVAHHEHAGPRRRRRSRASRTRASGRCSRTASRNTSLVDWWFGPDYTGSVLTIDGAEARRLRSSTSARDDSAWSRWRLATRGTELLQAGRRALRVGAGQGARTSTSRSTSRWTASATRRASSPRCATWTCCTRTRPTSTPRTSPTRSGRSSATPAATCRSRPQIEVQMGHGWAPAADGPRVRHPDRALVGRGDHLVRRPVHPDARDLRLGARPQAPGVVGRGPRRPGGVARPHHRRARSCAGRRIGGAEVAGIADRTGSLTPGKKADIVIIDGVGRERGADHRPGRRRSSAPRTSRT